MGTNERTPADCEGDGNSGKAAKHKNESQKNFSDAIHRCSVKSLLRFWPKVNLI